MKSGAHYFFVILMYILGLGWNVCGLIGFIWIIWAMNWLYTGGAVDHD
jgi:hypothetical protein